MEQQQLKQDSLFLESYNLKTNYFKTLKDVFIHSTVTMAAGLAQSVCKHSTKLNITSTKFCVLQKVHATFGSKISSVFILPLLPSSPRSLMLKHLPGL